VVAVALKNIRKEYANIEVLHGIDLDIRPGEFVVFVGPSGCGKSTLLRSIAGLESITSGDLVIDGQRMNDVQPSKRGISMVFQSYALYPHMTVYENMAFGLSIASLPKAEIDDRVQNAARVLQLSDYLQRLPKALSGGQRQRVAIGRAIVRNPRIFLFDEPLSNLDAALRVATRIEIAKLKESMPDVTMIYVTHDQVEAMTLADRIVVFRDGYVEQVGTPIDLYRRPANLFVARFIGSPAMNILGGTVSDEQIPRITLDCGGTLDFTVAEAGQYRGKRIDVGVRPESIELVSSPDAAALSGKIDFVENLGEVQILYVELPGLKEQFLIKTAETAAFTKRSTIAFHPKMGGLYYFDESGKAIASQS
jgi:multiple sugar transport system ATP-binding protein/alpha-glucoside transport system ATP-binding protein